MTSEEFDQAVAALIRGGRAAIDDDCTERVFIAACQVLRHRRNDIPDDQPIYPTDEEVIDVLTSANRRQRKLLKKIAESLIADTLYKH
jgi:hypothetical protein